MRMRPLVAILLAVLTLPIFGQEKDTTNVDSRAAVRESILAKMGVKQVGDASTDVLVVSPAGYQVLTPDANGLPSLLPITNYFKQVVNIGPAPGPGPPPPPPPQPPMPLTERAKAIKA